MTSALIWILPLILPIALWVNYISGLQKRTTRDTELSWQVTTWEAARPGLRHAGQISDSDYAKILLRIASDRNIYLAQARSVVIGWARFMRIQSPFVFAHWTCIAIALNAPEWVRSTLLPTTTAETIKVFAVVIAFLTIFLQILLRVVWSMFVDAPPMIRNHFNEEAGDALREHFGIGRQHRIELIQPDRDGVKVNFGACYPRREYKITLVRN